MTLVTVASVFCIIFLESDKVGEKLIWSTFVVSGFLLYEPVKTLSDGRLFQGLGVGLQIAELLGLFEHKKGYEEDLEKERASVIASIKSPPDSVVSETQCNNEREGFI
jgi:hypothetical protein